MTGREDQVLIIGRGNCGLALATGLKKHGVKYTIFERESEHNFVHRTRNWGMLLHWSKDYFRKLLPNSLEPRMKEVYVDPSLDAVNEPIPYFDASSRVTIRRIETPFINRVSRLKIRKFLTKGQDLNIQFSKRLTGITVTDEHAQVTLEDGTKYTGSMVIDADGSLSVVRSFLLGPEAAKVERIDHTMINFSASGYTSEKIQLLRSFHPITAYEEEMRPRGAEEVRLSLLQAETSRNGNIIESPMFKTGHQKVT